MFIWNYEEYDFFDNTVKRFASKFGVEFSEDEPGCMVITKPCTKMVWQIQHGARLANVKKQQCSSAVGPLKDTATGERKKGREHIYDPQFCAYFDDDDELRLQKCDGFVK